MIDSGSLNRESFEPLLNQIFEVVPKGMEKIEVELVAVEGTDTDQVEAFSLMFRGGRERVFRHDTHRVRHPGLGEFELFMGPVMTGKNDGIYYQAVFNRF
jgi:hypothetical protein